MKAKRGHNSSFVDFCKQLSLTKKKKKKNEGKGHSLSPTAATNAAASYSRSGSSSNDEGTAGLHAVFDHMDENRDGKISPEELHKSVKTLGGELSEEEAEAAVRLSDMDGDGLLDFEEFQKLLKGDGVTEEERKTELKEVFRMYSAEGKECITPGSLKKMLRKLGNSRTLDDCKAMIRAFDLNADGVLSFDEFALMMS